MNAIWGKKIVLGLSGGIACYKAAELCRLLIKARAHVQVVMTEAAAQFITPVTMQALSNQEVYTSQWDARASNNMAHINLTREADMVLVAPTSADFMAKLLHGQADDLLSLLCLARPMASCPLVLAPAMNREMWLHPATQRNVAQLSSDGAQVLGVAAGDQACGETGDGRMLEPAEIVQELARVFTAPALLGHRVLITAGPTFEAIDPVRGITNRSSGKMGYALASAAWQAGAEVTLVSGPVSLAAPRGVKRVMVESGQEMHEAVTSCAAQHDVFIATAAVADWRVKDVSTQKLKKTKETPSPVLDFIQNPDILASVAQGARAQSREIYCVGFAAETQDLARHAHDKRLSKGVPLMVGNLGPATFGLDDNELLIVDDRGSRTLPRASKDELAQSLVWEIAQRLPSYLKA
jgi:phosphopantothenoylcysteine decarboxylase/phosphopantothenate--cysteine ligase